MPNTSEKKFQAGVYATVVAPNATVRIDPELRDKEGGTLQVDVVELSPGFTLIERDLNPLSATFGTFVAQNVSNANQTLSWTARNNPTIFNPSSQTTLGTNGADPGPAGLAALGSPEVRGPFADRNAPGVNNFIASEVNNTVLQIDASTAAQAVNLPALGVANAGYKVTVVQTGGFLVTINPDAGDTISGRANYTMPIDRENVTLVFDGVTNWVVTEVGPAYVGTALGIPATTTALTGVGNVVTAAVLLAQGPLIESGRASFAANQITINETGEYEVVATADFLAPAGPANFQCTLHIRNLVAGGTTLRQADTLISGAASDVANLSCRTQFTLTALQIDAATNVIFVGADGTNTGTVRNVSLTVRKLA